MNNRPNFPKNFLADLNSAFNSLHRRGLSPAFLSDLKEAYSSLPLASEADLEHLAERFDAWRKRTEPLLKTYLNELADDDDPLLCPVSLFGTMDYGRLETAHTRTLAWLLHPRKEHGFGNSLIAALLSHLTKQCPLRELVVEEVRSELPIGGGQADASGRLDVFAEGRWTNEAGRDVLWVLVIEAKIDAGEGEEQLPKYEKWLRMHKPHREPLRVFLTADGRDASTGSEEWHCLSYLELAQIFRSVYDRLRDKHGFHFLRYYLAGVLKDICGWPLPVTESTANPYAVLDYLKTARKS